MSFEASCGNGKEHNLQQSLNDNESGKAFIVFAFAQRNTAPGQVGFHQEWKKKKALLKSHFNCFFARVNAEYVRCHAANYNRSKTIF